MLAGRLKLGLLGALVVGSLALTGCLRSMQTYTIYPDGSGKAEVKITLLGMMAQAAKMAKQQGGMEGQQDPLDQIKESLSGKVWWKDLEAKEGEAGTYVLSGTAYFDDVSEVELKDGSIQFAPEGDGYKLTIQQEADMPGGMGGEGEGTPEQQAQAEQMKAMIKGMLAGFEMSINVKLPGDVTAMDGFAEKEGRKAWIKIDEQALIKMIDANEKPPETMVATCGAAGDIQAEWDAFKKELAEAKAGAPAEEQAEPKEEEGGGQF